MTLRPRTRSLDAPAGRHHRRLVRAVAPIALVVVLVVTGLVPTLPSSPSFKTGSPSALAAASHLARSVERCGGGGACASTPHPPGGPASPDLGTYSPSHSVGWSKIAAPPSELGVGAAMVADTSASTAFVFGGENGNNSLVNATWAYGESNDSWWGVTSGDAPSPRSNFSFAIDPTTQTGVLFGGLTNTLNLSDSNTTWAYNLTTAQWTAEMHGPAPGAREAAAFAIAPTLGIGLLYGGWNEDFGPSESTTYSDLWEINLTTYAWSQVNVTGVRPPPLEGASLTWDPATAQFELFGGCYPCSADVWQFYPSSLNWTEVASGPGFPPARAGASWSYDPALGAVLLFGGTNGVSVFNDTYLYYPVGHVWVDQTLTPRPSERSNAASGFLDVPGNETWLVEGGVGPTPASNLWRLSTTSNLTITVVNASSPLSPLVDAEVNLSGHPAGVTNLTGNLTLVQVNGVGAFISVYRFGYVPFSETLWLPPGNSSNLTIALTPEHPGTVAVEVLIAPGEPVGGAELNLTVNGILYDPIPFVSNSQGNATFFGVTPGAINVTAYLAGLRPAYVDETLIPGGFVTGIIYISPDPVLTVTIFGRFPDGNLTPLFGVPVDLDERLFGTTNQVGQVIGTTTDIGFASLESSAPGYALNITGIFLPWTGSVQSTLVLRSLPFALLQVHVYRSGTTLPVSGALVNSSSYSFLPSGPFTALNLTNSSGVADLSVPQGSYQIVASASDYFTSNPTLLSVNASSFSIVNIFLKQIPGANLTIVVHDASNGAIISGAAIAGLPGPTKYSNATGVNVTDNIPPGTYLIGVAAYGYRSNTTEIMLRSAENRTLFVNLTPLPGTGVGAPWTFSLFPGSTAELWAFLLVPPLLIVGGFAWVATARAARREEESPFGPNDPAPEPGSAGPRAHP